MNKKILFITPEFYPTNGGVANAAMRFAEALVSNGYFVEVITVVNENNFTEKEDYKNIIIHRINYKKNPIWGNVKKIRWVYFVLKSLLIIKKSKPDIVFGQTILEGGAVSAMAGLLMCRLSVVYGHGTDVDLLKESRGVERMLNLFSLNYNDIVLATNNDFKNKMQLFSKKEVLILRNIVHIPELNFSRIDAKKNLHLQGDKFQILFVGRLIEIKGIKDLLEAMLKMSGSVLNIFGAGELEDYIRNFIKENKMDNAINIYGKVSNERIAEFMKACDVLVLPSHREGLSMTILEAMALGLPVIATSVGGSLDVIKNGENGLLVDEKKPLKLREAIIKLRDNKLLRENIGKKGRETAEIMFGAKSVVEEFKKIIEEKNYFNYEK